MTQAHCSSCPIGTLAALTAGTCYKRAFSPKTFSQCVLYCTAEPGWRLPCLSSLAETTHLGSLLLNESFFWVGAIQTDKSNEPAGNWHRIGCHEEAGTPMWWFPTEPNNAGKSEDCAVAGTAPWDPAGRWNDISCTEADIACVCETHLQGSIELEALGALEAAERSAAASGRADAGVEAVRTLVWILITLCIAAAPALLALLYAYISRTLKECRGAARIQSPAVDSAANAADAQRLLLRMRLEANRLQWWVSFGFAQAGWACAVLFAMFSVVLGFFAEGECTGVCPPAWAESVIFFFISMMGPTFIFSLLAVLPTDRVKVRVVGATLFTLMLLMAAAMLFLAEGCEWHCPQDFIPRRLPLLNVPLLNVPLLNVPLLNVPVRNVPLRNVPLRNVPCRASCGHGLTAEMCISVSRLHAVVSGRTASNGLEKHGDPYFDYFFIVLYLTISLAGFVPAALSIFPVIRGPLCCAKPTAPRKALGRIWAAVRYSLVMMSIAMLSFLIVDAARPARLDGALDSSIVSPLFPSLVCLLSAAVSTPSMRQRAHAAIGRLASKGESQQAASVAALVGRIGASEAKKRADATFCALPIDRLSLADLDKGTGAEGARALRDKVIPLALGSCSGFVSHSWYDAPSAKFEALTAWGRDAKKEMGMDSGSGGARVPTVWLGTHTRGRHRIHMA